VCLLVLTGGTPCVCLRLACVIKGAGLCEGCFLLFGMRAAEERDSVGTQRRQNSNYDNKVDTGGKQFFEFSLQFLKASL
jgi:hypothetical protein